MPKPPRLVSFLQARLSPEGYLGLHFTVGVLLILLSTWVFTEIADAVWNQEELTLFDKHFSDWVQTLARPWFTVFLLVITHLHSQLGVISIMFVFTLYFVRRRYRFWVMTLLLSVVGGMLLNVALKNIFERTRPSLASPILTVDGYGFPSGHTMAATCLYSALVVFGLWKTRNTRKRVLIIAGGVCMVLLVGFSRIYLGAHYLSDVLGAMAEGLAWVALCLTAIETLRRYRGRLQDVGRG